MEMIKREAEKWECNTRKTEEEKREGEKNDREEGSDGESRRIKWEGKSGGREWGKGEKVE